VIEMLPLGDLRAELTLMARWNLASLEHRPQLTTLLRREAGRLPADLLDEIYVRIVERPYEHIVKWLAEQFEAAGKPAPDLYALALVLTEAMSSYRFMQQTFGRVPDEIDDERLIAAWVGTALAVAAHHGLE
jgi:hypothetical protein